ncbi:MAG: MmgE/PrpD family protein [Betaproteobacteria bacterium]|nr:MmgE/PrpD family protein [Betaproteobacteria bacterium]
MDTTTERLVGYTTSFCESHLTESARAKTTDLLVDSMACAVVGAGSEPAAIVARIAKSVQASPSATVFGFGIRTSPDLAALANSMMVRTYDYNDAYFGHPSDMIPGVLAAGEIAHASGLQVMTAVALAYEIYGAFERSCQRVKAGFDQGTFMNIGVALAAGKLWKLTPAQLSDAASLALVPNLPLGVSRWGELSMMKGCATAFSVRNGLFAAMLAKEGFTSAPEPFEGIYGLHHVTGAFDLRLPLEKDWRVVEMAYIKPIPAENNTIGLTELAPRIREWSPIEEIASIDIEMAGGYEVHLGDEPKYDPRTRETADHSFPYILARALVDGGITLDSYTPERIADPSIRPLMRKIRVHGSDELRRIMSASRGPEAKPAKIRVRTTTGREFAEEIMGHSGHPDRPQSMRRDAINAKLDLCAQAVRMHPERREKIREAWWNIVKAADIGAPIGTMAAFLSPD